jgi:hypothetical protein
MLHVRVLETRINVINYEWENTKIEFSPSSA